MKPMTYARARADIQAKAPPGMVSTSQAAQAIGVNVATITQHVHRGSLVPAAVVDGVSFWVLDDMITQWARRVKMTSGRTPAVIRQRQTELQAAAPPPDTEHNDDSDEDLSPERYERERTRKTIAERRLLELKVQEQQGVLVQADAITRTWNAAAIELRDGIMVIGARLCHELAVLSDAREIKARIEAACRHALTAAAKKIATIEIAPTRAAEPEPETAPKPKAKPKAKR